MLKWSHRLRKSRRDSEIVIAILAVEGFHRQHLRRWLEYLAWIVLSVFAPKHVATLSIGVAQAQVRWWVESAQITSARFSLNSLGTVLTLEANYDVAEFVIRKQAPPSGEDIGFLDLARCYVGSDSYYYARLLETAVEFAKPLRFGIEQSGFHPVRVFFH